MSRFMLPLWVAFTVAASSSAVLGADPKVEITEPRANTKIGLAAHPVTVRGTYEGLEGRHAWVMCRDPFGYYLQGPDEVDLKAGGTWVFGNCRPNPGITEILVVVVDDPGHAVFTGMISKAQFGRILKGELKALAGFRELASVEIDTK